MNASLSPPRFLYFDLGNVLLYFDHRRAARQMAEPMGVPANDVWDFVFAGGLNHRLDAGTLTSEGFYELVCGQFNCRPGFHELSLAASDIFEMNYSLSSVIGRLTAAGHRMGVLSNTSDLHWNFLADGRYWLVPRAFEQVVLSYRVKLLKPDRKIYQLAADMAGVKPQEVFYVDDIAENVTGARTAGFDAVQFTSTRALVDELRRRNVLFNY